MNAEAYLRNHGWSGPGTPLNPNRRPGGPNGGLGLTKPILVARRTGNQGVGKKTTKDHTNQWWLRGFEDALKGVGGPANLTGSSVRPGNALTSELYRFFVRGETVAGTLGDKSAEAKADEGRDKGKGKREGESKEERRLRRTERKARKEERKTRREARRARRDERRAKKVEKRALKEAKRSRKEQPHNPQDDYPTPPATEQELIEPKLKKESKKSSRKEKKPE
ncbi:uncharacterized protein BDW47DRAFT_128229 [Aspergillus candidus]|uniref:G-patch domain-containing protein n=1 Tax=Aspergillus candidus TaxID=41067 RepID=A0A2I2F3S6_ASPCN|nr:hypothetical protein BDW47DRAFT_128229 [Aspergillus candidus]PLB35297.1 hypothetical protein BDW47DRAFT_128229 [Aspergillus candidus]